MPIPGRLIAVVLLAAVAAALTWQFQDWRYGRQLAEQGRAQAETLNQLSLATATVQKAEQDKRLALEQRLSASEQIHFESMTHAEKDQARLRDRLATADLRLSVLLDGSSASGCAMPAAPGTGSVDHAAIRARLDPAHAQRIVAITDSGDRGLIALQACQAYVRALAPAHFE